MESIGCSNPMRTSAPEKNRPVLSHPVPRDPSVRVINLSQWERPHCTTANNITAITTEPAFWERGAHWPLIGRGSPLVVSQRAFGGNWVETPRGESRGGITKGEIWHTTLHHSTSTQYEYCGVCVYTE